jgi:serine/threonine protein kinase
VTKITKKIEQKSNDRVVAIKAMSVDSDEDGIVVDRAAMTSEVEMMVRLSRCEFIISYYGAFWVPSLQEIWISMELCCVGSALDLLRLLRNPFPEIVVRSITKDALSGLIFLHRQKIIHRDLVHKKKNKKFRVF